MAEDELSTLSKEPLTGEENQLTRWIIEHHKRKKWLVGWLYRLAIAAGAVAGAVAAARAFIGSFVK